MASEKIVVDTCVFLNVFFQETKLKKNVYETSKRLLEAAIECSFDIYVSEKTIFELSKKLNISKKHVKAYYLKPLINAGKLYIMKINQSMAEEKTYIESIFGVHTPDSYMWAISKELKIKLVTRDNGLLELPNEIGVTVLQPDELV
ncbi:MAG: type II toxin-antitoxin system VapC family toxin [Candidatus Hodarchaeales archaeon]